MYIPIRKIPRFMTECLVFKLFIYCFNLHLLYLFSSVNRSIGKRFDYAAFGVKGEKLLIFDQSTLVSNAWFFIR